MIVALSAGGVGRHIIVVVETTPEKIVPWAKVVFIIPIIYAVAIAVPKVIILIFYLRIFVARAYRFATYSLIVLVAVSAIIGVVTGGLVCRPISRMWNKDIEGSCYNIPAYYRWGPLPYIFTDLAILILPIPAVWSVQTSRRNKVVLTATFLVGGV